MNTSQKSKKFTLSEELPVFILQTLTLLYSYFIVNNADWTWGDDFGFLLSTANKNIMWAYSNDLGCLNNLGRFFPMAQFDFNILLLFDNCVTPLAHYIWVAFTFLLFVYFSFKLYKLFLEETGIKDIYINWLILSVLAFQFYYFYRAFFFLVYPERIILLLLTIFFYQFFLFVKYDKFKYAAVALVVSFYLLFTKETMFVVFSVVSFVGLVPNFTKLTVKRKVYYYILLVGVIAFLVIYYFAAYNSAESFYSRNSTFSEVIQYSFGNLKVLYLALLVFLWRIFIFIKTRKLDYLVLDIMLISGLLYGLANIILKLPMEYYYFPAVFLVLLPVIFWAVKYFNPKWIIVAMFLLTLYYWRKFPDVIENVQNLRLNTSKNVIYLADNVRNANKVLWLENNNNASASKGIIGYQKDILSVYLHFYDPDFSEKDIITINDLSDHQESGTLIFYSDLNNTPSESLFKADFEKVNLPFIHQLSIFRKK